MYFSAGAEGRISYGHLGRTNLFYSEHTDNEINELKDKASGTNALRRRRSLRVARRMIDWPARVILSCEHETLARRGGELIDRSACWPPAGSDDAGPHVAFVTA